MQDATVQSIPQTSQPPPWLRAATWQQHRQPVSSSTPGQFQAGVAYPQAVPQAAPQVAPNYQSAPSAIRPPFPTGSDTPGPESMGVGVQPSSGSSGPVSASPSQAAPSPVQAPAASPYTQAQLGVSGSPATYQQTSVQSAAPTWQQSQTSSPNSSQTSSVSSLEDVANLLEWSPESRMVVANYGTEAPAILNQYALNLEGMLDSAVAWGERATNCLKGYANFSVNEHKENLAYNEILTNPDTFCLITHWKFFGPEGPYPVYESEARPGNPWLSDCSCWSGWHEHCLVLPAPPQLKLHLNSSSRFLGMHLKQQMDV